MIGNECATNLDPYGRNGSGFVWYCTVIISINDRTNGMFREVTGKTGQSERKKKKL